MSFTNLVQHVVRGASPFASRRGVLPLAAFAASAAITTALSRATPQFGLIALGLGLSASLGLLVFALQGAGAKARALAASRAEELVASQSRASAIAEQLHRSEQRFRNLFESIGDPIIVTGIDRRLEVVNPAMLRAFGYENEAALIGQMSSITYADEEMFEEAGRRLRERTDDEPFMIDARFRRANGEPFPAELRLCVVHNDAGEATGYIGVIRDITRRRETEAALRRSEGFATAIFDNSPIGIHVLDAEGYSLRMNRAFQEIMGLPSTSFGVGQFNVLTNGFFNRVGISDSFRRAYAGEIVEVTDAVLEITSELEQLPEASIAYDLTLFPIHSGDGTVQAVVSFARDISERKQADVRRMAAEERLRLVLANLPLRVFAADADGAVTFVDGKLASLSGLPAEELVGRRIDDIFAGAEFATLLPGVRRGLAAEDFTELVEFRGRTYEVRYSPLRNAIDGPGGLVWIYTDVTEREQAERQRQENQANFTALIENTDSYMWSVRPGYHLLSANPAFRDAVAEFVGHDVGPGDTVLEGFGPAEQEEWRSYYDRAFAGERFTIERDAPMPNGARRLSEVRFNPIRDGEDEVIGATVVSRDITESKLAEIALRESEERYRRTFESLHDVFYQTNLDDVFTLLSPSASKLHGWTAEELTGTKTRDLYLNPADQDGLVAELMAGRKVNGYEAQMVNKDGSVIWVSINAKLIAKDGVAFAVQGTTRDITERRLAEQAIRESEERYRKTFEGLHDVFYQTDAQGVITMMSPSCLAHTGYTPDELVGQPVRALFADEERFNQIVSGLADADTLNDQEAMLALKGGGAAPVSVNATALRDEDGNIYGFEGTLRDIAERKRAEEELDRVFNLTVDLLSVVATGGALLRVNPAWKATLGYTESELLGLNVWSLLHQDDLAEARRGARTVDAGKIVKDLRARFRCKDGSWKWLGWSMTRSEGSDSIYCVARDVSELMYAEEQMREAQEELEQSLEAMRASQAVLQEQAEAMDQMRIEAEYLANHDVLTGVVNRRAWFGEATAGKPTAIAIFDIDYFKRVNDTYGHPAGDAVLVEISRRLRDVLPEGALLGRLGGEEFGVLFFGPFGEARAASEQAVCCVSETPIALEDGSLLSVAVSGGLAPWRASHQSRERSLSNTYEDADAALYEAKAAGRRRLTIRDSQQAA